MAAFTFHSLVDVLQRESGISFMGGVDHVPMMYFRGSFLLMRREVGHYQSDDVFMIAYRCRDLEGDSIIHG